MLPAKVKQRKKKPQCFADLVTDVPSIITNDKTYISYDCLHFLGSVSNWINFVIISRQFFINLLSFDIIKRISMEIIANQLNFFCNLAWTQGSYGKCYEVAKKTTAERFACKIISKISIVHGLLGKRKRFT